MSKKPIRIAIFSDFNTENLARILDSEPAEPALKCLRPPFGSLVPSLLGPFPTPDGEEPEFGLAWSRPEAAVPLFAKVLRNESARLEDILGEVDLYGARLAGAAKRLKALAAVTWTLPPWYRGLGGLDASIATGHHHVLQEMNRRLVSNLRNGGGVYVLDAQAWIAETGPKAYSSHMWYLSKTPFAQELFRRAALEIKAFLRTALGGTRKLVLLDLDDTLWGGIVGDAGRENLALGGHDAIGEAFVDFQKALLSLKNRGILLAVISKNTETVALDAIDNHPEMILRRKDFVGWRINWNDKAANIADLVSELNLGLQSAVFIDDNHLERERVRQALPEVFVPDWPKDKMLYVEALAALTCFDTLGVSAEDTKRTEEYLNNKRRDELRQSVGSVDEWLKGIELKVRVEGLTKDNFPRVHQLLNKTNQMNLSTRRLTEQQLSDWAGQPDNRMFVFRVSDKFDDSGITGIASIRVEGPLAKVTDFVLSCRVMGRKVEQAMLHVLTEHAASMGAERLQAAYLPTAKNQPCLEFLKGSALKEEKEGSLFTWSLASFYPRPDCLQLFLEQVTA